MKRANKIAVCAAAVFCGAALVLSIVPGLLNTILFYSILLGFFFFPFFFIPTAYFAYRFRLKPFDADKIVLCVWRPVVIICLFFTTTYVSLKLYLPRRIAFECCRSSFEELVSRSENLDQYPSYNVGPYSIDSYLKSENGGHYFLVYSSMDGLGPDETSYGFCFKPDRVKSPFGTAGYRIFRLGDHWYWFRASNDFF